MSMTEREREIERARELVGYYVMDFEMDFAENDKYPSGIDGAFIGALQTLLDKLKQYRAIGTVSEFKQLKEKATAKKAIVSRSKHEAYCPHCKSVVADDEFWALDEYVHHCECGQAIFGTDWSEGKE